MLSPRSRSLARGFEHEYAVSRKRSHSRYPKAQPNSGKRSVYRSPPVVNLLSNAKIAVPNSGDSVAVNDIFFHFPRKRKGRHARARGICANALDGRRAWRQGQCALTERRMLTDLEDLVTGGASRLLLVNLLRYPPNGFMAYPSEYMDAVSLMANQSRLPRATGGDEKRRTVVC